MTCCTRSWHPSTPSSAPTDVFNDGWSLPVRCGWDPAWCRARVWEEPFQCIDTEMFACLVLVGRGAKLFSFAGFLLVMMVIMRTVVMMMMVMFRRLADSAGLAVIGISLSLDPSRPSSREFGLKPQP